MFEIRRAKPSDAQTAFDIRLQAIRHQCIGAYTMEQMLAWTAGAAYGGYGKLMDMHFDLGCIDGERGATGCWIWRTAKLVRSSCFRVLCGKALVRKS